jgi:hypothetical protein
MWSCISVRGSLHRSWAASQLECAIISRSIHYNSARQASVLAACLSGRARRATVPINPCRSAANATETAFTSTASDEETPLTEQRWLPRVMVRVQLWLTWAWRCVCVASAAWLAVLCLPKALLRSPSMACPINSMFFASVSASRPTGIDYAGKTTVYKLQKVLNLALAPMCQLQGC